MAMNYSYVRKQCFLGLFVSLIVLSALGNQYTIVNNSGSEVTLYFGPERNIDNYPVIAIVKPKENKTVNTSFIAQTIKCKTDRTSLIGKAVRFVYPNTACSNIMVQIQDSNTDLVVSANCN